MSSRGRNGGNNAAAGSVLKGLGWYAERRKKTTCPMMDRPSATEPIPVAARAGSVLAAAERSIHEADPSALKSEALGGSISTMLISQPPE